MDNFNLQKMNLERKRHQPISSRTREEKKEEIKFYTPLKRSKGSYTRHRGNDKLRLSNTISPSFAPPCLFQSRLSRSQEPVKPNRPKIEQPVMPNQTPSRNWVPKPHIRKALNHKIRAHRLQLLKRGSILDNDQILEPEEANRICADIDCEDYSRQSELVQCRLCGDHYHLFCMQPPLKNTPDQQTDVFCHVCFKQHTKLINEHYCETEKTKLLKRRKRLCCYKCGYDHNLFLCSICNEPFHEDCLEKDWEKGNVLCDNCEARMEAPRPGEVAEFYCSTRAMRQSRSQPVLLSQLVIEEENSMSQAERKLGFRKGPKSQFALPKHYSDKTAHMIRTSLYAGLKARSMKFTDDNLYREGYATPDMNNTELEVGPVQQLSKTNEKIFQRFKTRSRQGFYCNVEIVNTLNMGMAVVARDPIKEMTLIAEYAGEVRTLRSALVHKSDSIMDLLCTPFSATSLVIIPDDYANLARFLNGVNTKDRQGKKKENVRSMRVSVEGRACVILYACRRIHRGEQLLYNYNGATENYPDDNFT